MRNARATRIDRILGILGRTDRKSAVKLNLAAIANVATIVACLLVTLAVVPTLKTAWSGSTKAADGKAQAIEHVDNLRIAMPKANVKGDPRAKVIVIEFADFQCPFCGKYARETFPEIQRQYIDAGQAMYGYRHFPLVDIHPLARDAGKAALCAGDQQKFWPMHDRLLLDRHSLALADLMTDADHLGLDRARFDACLNAPAPLLDEDIAEARRLGVIATPTFFVGTVEPDGNVRVTSKIHGARALPIFRSAFAEALRLSSS